MRKGRKHSEKSAIQRCQGKDMPASLGEKKVARGGEEIKVLWARQGEVRKCKKVARGRVVKKNRRKGNNEGPRGEKIGHQLSLKTARGGKTL